MLLSLCFLGALATCGLGFSSKDKTKLINLDQDIEQEKKYKDDKEETEKKKIFEDNTKLIKDINKKHADGKLTYYAGVNEFADLTHEEILNHYTGLLPIETMSTRSDSSLFRRRRSLPVTMDWRNAGLVTDVKNQGRCGSCWAFSVTGALEGQYKKKTGQLISFSEQQLVDCNVDNNGCNGGSRGTAFKYVQANGIEGQADYPYAATVSTCKYNKSLVKANSTGYVRLPANDEQALAYNVAQAGPIAVTVDVSQPSFDYYRGGVYNEPNCSSVNHNHAMLAVGYGTSNGQDYWLVKNTWGTSWGMDGYIQMSRNKNNQCGIATSGIYPLM